MLSKLKERKLRNRVIYIICFFCFLLIDHRVKSVSSREGGLFAWQNALGIIVAVLIFTHYRWDELKKYKNVYIVWSGLSIIGGFAYYVWRSSQTPFYLNATIVFLVDIILFGYIIIHTYMEMVIEKRFPAVNKAFLFMWMIMMILMVISKSKFQWPLGYLIIFGCFYLTDFSKEEFHEMIVGAGYGFVLAFFVIQGLAFVFRPFDNVNIRYMGMYTNSNQNALFYLAVLVAALIMSIYMRMRDKKAGYIFFMLGVVVVLDFLFLTLGRTALGVAFILVLLFLKIMYKRIFSVRAIKSAILIIGGMIIMFPLCFASVRYLPPLFHHPIWFDGEWHESKVHSWDAWNSDKYIDFDEYKNHAFGRFEEAVQSIWEHSPFKLDVEAADVESDASANPLLTMEEANDSVLVRKTIYQHYLENMKWFGRPYNEQGVLISEIFFTYHAHNFYIQYGTDFGIPVMILLIILVIWSCFIYVKRIYKDSNIEDIAMLMFILVPALYGILEYSWGVGSIGTTMLFLAWGFLNGKISNI